MVTSRRLLAQVVVAKLVAEPKRQAHIIKATAAYMVEHKMADQPHIFINDLARELQRQTGHLSAELVTAFPAGASLLKQLEAAIKTMTGAKTIDLEVSHDAELLGGFIIRTPEAMVDRTIRQQLSQLRNIA